jgi:hypothetical protein
VGDVVSTDQDHGEVGQAGEGTLDLERKVRGLRADDRHAVQFDRAGELFGQAGGEQRADGQAGSVDAVSGG